MASPHDPLQADPLAQASDPMAQPMDPMAQPMDAGADPAGFDPMPMVPAGTAVRKQRFSIYTMMLILSAIFLGISCYCLHQEQQLYGTGGDPWNGTNSVRAR